MNLPELPKKNKKREANFGIEFRAWLKNNPMSSASFELKQTDTALAFSEVGDNQIAYGLQVQKGVLIRVQGVSGEPDYVYLNKASAYVVIKYGSGAFYIIHMKAFVSERDTSDRKSLTEERARAIAMLCV